MLLFLKFSLLKRVDFVFCKFFKRFMNFLNLHLKNSRANLPKKLNLRCEFKLNGSRNRHHHRSSHHLRVRDDVLRRVRNRNYVSLRLCP